MVALNAANLDIQTIDTTLSVLLKHESDLQRARRWLQRPSNPNRPPDEGDLRASRWKN
jgi:hypothetical protein